MNNSLPSVVEGTEEQKNEVPLWVPSRFASVRAKRDGRRHKKPTFLGVGNLLGNKLLFNLSYLFRYLSTGKTDKFKNNITVTDSEYIIILITVILTKL